MPEEQAEEPAPPAGVDGNDEPASQTSEVQDEVFQPPEEAVWNSIDAYMKSCGVEVTRTLFHDLDKQTKYKDWLQDSLHLEGSGLPPSGASPAKGVVDALCFPPDMGRSNALRAVSPQALLKKMRSIAVAQTWRDWDVAIICHVPGGDDSSEAQLFYIDFHIRACALHALLALHWHRGTAVPEWLAQMAGSINYFYKGSQRRVDASAAALSIAASTQEGATKLAWLDIVMQAKASGDAFGRTLREKVFEICPEYAAAVNSWQFLEALTTRVSSRCWEMVEQELQKINMPAEILPQRWFRESFMLLASSHRKKKAEAEGPTTDDEQYVVFARLMGAVTSAWEANPDFNNSCQGLGRLLPESTRKTFTQIGKKFIRGMAAAEVSTGITAAEVLPRFRTGEFDAQIRVTSDVTNSARFWPWVKEAMASRQREEDARGGAEAEAKAAAALATAAGEDPQEVMDTSVQKLRELGRAARGAGPGSRV